MAKLVDALALGASEATHGGSSPLPGTTIMHDAIKKLILENEKDTRVALTKQYPFLVIPVLETKRLINKLRYNLSSRFDLKHSDPEQTTAWFNMTEHSSPLYRKYNKRELDDGKILNIQKAIHSLDGLVLEPGQIFSFWKFVGRTGEKNGFSRGLVLSDGKLLEDFGGGLCQLSNLIAYMFACTECTFIERRHHSRDVFPDSNRSVPFASGATVFYNLIDLKVQNTYSFPIRINLRTTDTQLRGSLSAPHQLDYSVSLQERDAGFIKSKNSGSTYRYNKLVRVFYKKGLPDGKKEILREEPLWENLAIVMYPDSQITSPIETT